MIDQPRLEVEQIGPLFEYLETHPKGSRYLLNRRNHVFFLLAYYTGARPVELLSLSLRSFNDDMSVLRVVGAK